MNCRTIEISPSLMCADVFSLGETLATFEKHGIEWLHIDVMDGHYVPNMALSPDFCQMVASHTRIPLDIHLMVEGADRFVELFGKFPGARISFHPEAVRQPVRTIQRIRELGCLPGVAADPGIPIEAYRHLLPLVEHVLIMTVNPGYAGQKVIPFCIDKIADCRTALDAVGSSARIEVDGNVSWENMKKMLAAGADMLVAGTASLFKAGRVNSADIEKMRALVAV